MSWGEVEFPSKQEEGGIPSENPGRCFKLQ